MGNYQMTRYKQAEFEEDSSSIGSVQLTEGVSTTATHIRYHTATLPGSTLWKARTLLEKCLILCTISLVLLLIVIITVLGSRPDQFLHVGTATNFRDHLSAENSHESRPQYCLTETCVRTAAGLLSSIDNSVDPCEDFYEYSCGSWVRANPIPDGKSMWGTFVKLDQQNQLVVKNALQKPYSELKSKSEQKAKSYYLSCMDVNETIEELGAKPMLDLLDQVGGWNVSGSAWNVSTFSLQTTLHILQNKYNMGGLFSWAVQEDDRNSSLYIIQIDQGGLTLPTRDTYLNKTANEKVLTAYLDYMTKIGVLLGGEPNSTKAQMQQVIDFETKLADITIPSEDRRDEEKMYHRVAIAELQEIAPFMSWKDYFSDALRLVNKKITDKEKVVVYAPDYLRNLTIIIREYNATLEGKTILNNYLVWQTVRSLTACLSKPFRDAYKGLRKALIGAEGGEEPWRYCVSDTNNVIGFAIGAMYVRELFQGNSKTMAEEMINSVRTAFKENLKYLTWMDAETRLLAQEKADAITDMIGFPDFILDAEKLDERYKELNVNQNTYFQNNIHANQFNLRRNLQNLGTPVNKTRWNMTPPTVNAYYTPTRNQIVFPAGILQAPFYDISHQQALNYGAMGVVMGHELTHAFDDQGREYDKIGNLHQWWNNKTIEKFKNQTDCVVKQYSDYEINGKHLNGKQTLGENIADNGGLKAAFRAYLDWVSKNKEELRLPALNLTHRQLFFLSFAQVWCSASTEEATNLQIEKDAHAPPKFRVIGSLSNSPDFAREFNCPLGSKMNPVKKCEVW
ncbi:endothelin-converting enzyme homolog isoform X3 [Homalodisca vitripennis]|uniref:endothelin-converting enzyme homolog isoform X3 n=1 Tax=Homalodisca vitripennis TaxID=197043 RepID=UPI001EECD69D|nr:endothelin-converting enzyme homolog isoform X3 [Homalodisca vitripennis]